MPRAVASWLGEAGVLAGGIDVMVVVVVMRVAPEMVTVSGPAFRVLVARN